MLFRSSEKEVAWRLHQLLHAHGADNPAFESIIAGGVNGSKPHATPSDDVIPRATLLERVAGCDAVLSLLTEKVDAEFLNAAGPNLKVVANLAVGFDNFDVPAMTARQVIGTNTPEVLTDTTADLAFSLLMATARMLPQAQKYVHDGKWTTWAPLLFRGQDIHHATIGQGLNKGIGCIRQGKRRGSRNRSRHIGNTIVNYTIYNKGRICMGSGFRRFKTAALVNGNIYYDCTCPHFFNHIPRH